MSFWLTAADCPRSACSRIALSGAAMTAPSPRVSAREAKAAEKEADVVLKSLSRAGDAAIQTTLRGICDKLKNNVPLMYHISALLHNPEWTGVLEASIAGGASSGDKPEDAAAGHKKVWKLRTVVKKFAHIDRRVWQGATTKS